MHRVGVIQAKSQLPALMDETENDGRLPIDLATFVHDLRYEDLPDDVLVVLRRSLLDTIGVAAIGSTTALSGRARAFAERWWCSGADAPSSRVLFDGGRASPPGAAMAGAFTIDSIDGRIGVEELGEAVLHDPEILRISRGMEVVELEHYTAISTRQRWADVTLFLGDGRVLESGARTPRGDPEMPLSGGEIAAKFQLFADPVIGVSRAGEIGELCAGVDRGGAEFEGLLERVYAPGS